MYTSVREAQADQVLQFAQNACIRDDTDVVIIAGDFNSSPNSPVYNRFSGYVDTLVDKFGPSCLSSTEYATWGRPENTWSGPNGDTYDGYNGRCADKFQFNL